MKARHLLFFLVFVLAAFNCPAAGWEIRKLGGRDYLPLTQVADFYRMRVVPRGDSRVSLAAEMRRMDFVRGSREARIDGVKHWLSFPVIFFGGRFYVSRMDLSKTIDPAMRPEKIPQLQPVRSVLLDPGHGDHDRGAVNRLGAEKNYNLAIALEVRKRLTEAGLRTEMTRSTDRFIPLEVRPALARKLGDGTIFVSIHCNDAGQYSLAATGFEIYTLAPRGAPNSNDTFLTRRSFSAESGHLFDNASQALSASIYHAMLGRAPMFDRGMKRARFAVLRRAITPAVLIECGFLSNSRDARLLDDARWRTRLADSIARGIIEFCNLSRARKPPKLLAQYRQEEAAQLAGAEYEYNPLAGIGGAVQTGFGLAQGWRGLLAVPLREDVPPFKIEFEPAGWVLLEAWAAADEDARSVSRNEQADMMEQSEWPDPAPAFGGLRGWRELFPEQGLDRGFVLFGNTSGPINGDAASSATGDDAHGIPEIMGGRL